MFIEIRQIAVQMEKLGVAAEGPQLVTTVLIFFGEL